MRTDNIFAALDLLEEACSSITSKFHVEKSQVERLLAGISTLKGSRDAFAPTIAICGDRGVGKTTLLKYLTHDWAPEVLHLPTDGAAAGVPTILQLSPEETYNIGNPAAHLEIHYLTRNEYFDGALWVIENLAGHGEDKIVQGVADARSNRSFEALKRACDAAHDACGADRPEMRKSLRKIADDCRNGEYLEKKFREYAAQGYRRICNSIADLRTEEGKRLMEFAKSTLVTIRVDKDKIPCSLRIVDLPGCNSDSLHHLAFGYQLSRRGADAMVVCLSADNPTLDEISAKYLDMLVGQETHVAHRGKVFYVLTRAISPTDERQDAQAAESVFQDLVSVRNWIQPSPLRIFVTDALAGVLHDLRALPDLQVQARNLFGIDKEQDFKSIKKRWNAGRVGDDNASLKLILRKQLTYTWPKENFAAVKSAVAELTAKYKSIVESVKPEQSKWHKHKFNSIQSDAQTQFEACAASIENQADHLHKALRHEIIGHLSKTLAGGKAKPQVVEADAKPARDAVGDLAPRRVEPAPQKKTA
jgi:hypothetical protein